MTIQYDIFKKRTLFIRLTALGAYFLFLAHEGGRLLFSQHCQQAMTFSEKNKTRDNRFISLQQGETKCKTLHEQNIKFIDCRKPILEHN